MRAATGKWDRKQKMPAEVPQGELGFRKNAPKKFCEGGLGGRHPSSPHRVGRGRGRGAPLFYGGPHHFYRGPAPLLCYQGPPASAPYRIRTYAVRPALQRMGLHIRWSAAFVLISRVAPVIRRANIRTSLLRLSYHHEPAVARDHPHSRQAPSCSVRRLQSEHHS